MFSDEMRPGRTFWRDDIFDITQTADGPFYNVPGYLDNFKVSKALTHAMYEDSSICGIVSCMLRTETAGHLKPDRLSTCIVAENLYNVSHPKN